MGKKSDIDEVINKAIARAVEAGRISAERTAKDAFKATERRLYALPILRQRLEDNRERLAELEKYGPRGRSKSITRFQKSGVRLSPDEIHDAIHADMVATIDADEYEIADMERALAVVADDEYCEREELKTWVRTAAGWEKIDHYTLAQLREVKRILEGHGEF